VTLLSNGYGEDAVGARLACELRRLEPLHLQAYPTVGTGDAYEAVGVPVLGPRRTLPSGGLMMHSAQAFWGDLRAGFLPLTRRQLTDLKRLQTDALIVVGDLYALLLGCRVGTRARFYVQTLVSVTQRRRGGRPNRYFMERFSPLERRLMRRAVQHSYVRDAATASYLRGLGVPASALGNPMFDPGPAEPDAATALAALSSPVVGLLPGTRGYREASLELMLRALATWPAATGVVAWTGQVLPPGNWEPLAAGVWRRGRHYLLTGRFAEVLRRADLVLGTSGTANEQAAALGRPVVAFPVPPLYTPAFLANQRRLLGDALTVCKAEPHALGSALRALWCDPERYRQAAEAGKTRLAGAGGGRAIARDVLARLHGQAHPH
jgi:uncharacterized protein (TIGR03492 family)